MLGLFNKNNDSDNILEESATEQMNKKLRRCFDGKIVRKDLTKSIKEGANVPVYVLEFLLGQYCNSDDEDIVSEGVKTVKKFFQIILLDRTKHKKFYRILEKEVVIQLLIG